MPCHLKARSSCSLVPFISSLHRRSWPAETMITFGDSDMLKGSSYQCQQLHLTSFIRDVNYSCGSCGYELNLSSSNRNTSSSLIDSKSLKRGLISFFSVDESRFTQIHQRILPWSWIPFFKQPRRTKLLCRRCGTHLGCAYTLPSHSHSWDGISGSRIYDIKLSTLQPSFSEDPNLMSDDMGRYKSASSTAVFVF